MLLVGNLDLTGKVSFNDLVAMLHSAAMLYSAAANVTLWWYAVGFNGLTMVCMAANSILDLTRQKRVTLGFNGTTLGFVWTGNATAQILNSCQQLNGSTGQQQHQLVAGIAA